MPSLARVRRASIQPVFESFWIVLGDILYYHWRTPEAEKHDGTIKRLQEALICELKLWEGYLGKVTPVRKSHLPKRHLVNAKKKKVLVFVRWFSGWWRLPGREELLSGWCGCFSHLSLHLLLPVCWLDGMFFAQKVAVEAMTLHDSQRSDLLFLSFHQQASWEALPQHSSVLQSAQRPAQHQGHLANHLAGEPRGKGGGQRHLRLRCTTTVKKKKKKILAEMREGCIYILHSDGWQTIWPSSDTINLKFVSIHCFLSAFCLRRTPF